ncbi:MAG TPA: hypothetical protein VFP68_20830 [Burkholderiaceae bacterium]|nr:hypothetical protein [Burkholderiaceae bacterium]
MAAMVALAPIVASAADWYVHGTLSNITSTAEGLLVMLDSGTPTNCAGTPYGWMLIKEANKTMVATALTMWLSGQRAVTIYTNPFSSGQSFCVVSQIDPD